MQPLSKKPDPTFVPGITLILLLIVCAAVVGVNVMGSSLLNSGQGDGAMLPLILFVTIPGIFIIHILLAACVISAANNSDRLTNTAKIIVAMNALTVMAFYVLYGITHPGSQDQSIWKTVWDMVITSGGF